MQVCCTTTEHNSLQILELSSVFVWILNNLSCPFMTRENAESLRCQKGFFRKTDLKDSKWSFWTGKQRISEQSTMRLKDWAFMLCNRRICSLTTCRLITHLTTSDTILSVPHICNRKLFHACMNLFFIKHNHKARMEIMWLVSVNEKRWGF